MIPTTVISSFVAALIFTTIVPIALLIVLGVKRRISGLPLLLGAAAFFVSQIVLRIPLINAFSGQSWFQSIAAQFLPYVLILCLSAGLFEESARLGGALLLKKHRSFKDIVSFGLGHGLCEVIILIGFAHINNVVYCLAINDTGGAFSGMLTPETLEAAKALLIDVRPAHIYLGILERFSAVLFHIFATVLVFRAVIKRKRRLYVLAIGAHMLFNLLAVLLARYAGLVVTEAVLLVAALAAGVYVLKCKSSLEAVDNC